MEVANKVGLTCQHITLSFPFALVSYFLVKWVDAWLHWDNKSVFKLQVGLSGTHPSLQRDLKRIADASTSKGLSYVLQEAIVALLRHSDYCVSGYSSVDVKRSVKEGEKRFNHLYIEERSKFDEESLVNVDIIRKNCETTQSSNNKYIVVTIIVVAWGAWELSPVKSSAQLKQALLKLAPIPSNYIVRTKVLWNPHQENDSLTAQKLLEDYPMLHAL